MLYVTLSVLRGGNFMTLIQDRTHCPDSDEIELYIGNPVFGQFCSDLRSEFHPVEKTDFSSCSLQPGWNLKFRKAGKTLCTIYPAKTFFTVMVVIGNREREAAEAILPECSEKLQKIYAQTAEGNGQKWLMIDLKEKDSLYRDVFRLIRIRRNL